MTISTTSTPHDAVFKSFLRHPDTARDFIDIHLPAPLRKLCDLTTLKLEPNSFIDEDLRQYYSDLLWSVKTQEGVGYIYVVIEHQSKPEELMAFRMMRYSIAAMQNHLDAGYKELPLVLPMLFYHGCRSPYPYSLCWLDEFAEPAIARKIYSSAFPLVDITVVPDDEIMQHRKMALLELIQKHIRQRDLLGLVDQIVSLLVTGNTNDRPDFHQTILSRKATNPVTPGVNWRMFAVNHISERHPPAPLLNRTSETQNPLLPAV